MDTKKTDCRLLLSFCIQYFLFCIRERAGDFTHSRPSHELTTFADGLAVRVAIATAVSLLNDAADQFVTVSERQIARALGRLDAAGIRIEGAAAAPLAAQDTLEGAAEPIVLIVTGCNIDDDLHRRAVDDPDSFPG